MFSAVVVGCFAPDFEYFIRLAPEGNFGHTLPGLFLFNLPLGLVMLWLFHRYAKDPLWTWLPNSLRQRTKLGPRTLPFKNAAQFALVLISILVGSVSHILWDWFTHLSWWPRHYWYLLSYTVQLPVVGGLTYFEMFHHVNTAFGTIVLLIWFMRWFSTTSPVHSGSVLHSRATERRVFVVIFLVALVGGTSRAFLGAGRAIEVHTILFIAEAVITTISVFWIELVIYGILRDRTSRHMQVA